MGILSWIMPDIVISKVTELNELKIYELKEKYQIEGLILDVDETLRYDMQPITSQNKKWLMQTRETLKIIVVSNGYDYSINDFLDSLNIEYISTAFKPLKKPFIKASKQLDIVPEKIMVVGDSYFDDIVGGKLNNMITAWIRQKF